ncbi:DNA-3-methyladenine glycosylase 2 family protein [Flavobacterium sp.]|uniref:DNA-3-methyladenine glycosylase family protein n=1 Tax=Flavobacterium sp. TaxID=239 RepID=UPI00261B9427|nr:DNA-3-methyladenine glycosylase 2 family protein [Flavobacterium sp.]
MKHAIDHLANLEPVFQKIIDQYGQPKIPYRPQGFETLVVLILEQQVSIDSAKATFLKLKTKAVSIEPQTLVVMSDEDFRAVGVSRQKTGYIKGLSQIILNEEIHLESFSEKSAVEVRNELIKIKGIGHWTIDVYLMFSLQAQDVMPLGDIAVVNTLKELFDIHDKEAMEAFAMQWAPYRTAATFLLWHHYLNKRNRSIEYLY